MFSSERDRCLVRLVTSSGPPALGLLRDRIEAVLPGLDARVVGDVQIVCTELVTNACLHGSPPISFELVIPSVGTPLRMEVSDAGPGTPVAGHPGAETMHGRGLLLVGKLAAAWGVTRTVEGKTVWAEFVLDAPSTDR